MKYEKFDYLFFIIVVALLLVLAMAAHGENDKNLRKIEPNVRFGS